MLYETKYEALNINGDNEKEITKIMIQDLTNSINNNIMNFDFGRYNISPEKVDYTFKILYMINGKLKEMSITTYPKKKNILCKYF